MPEERRGYELALQHIQDAILAGDMQVGDRIPGERDLAAELNVSRGAVREAIRVLQAYGVLESHPGPGRGTRIIAMQSRALSTTFSLHLATAAHSRQDLSETRVALERATAAAAAQAWTDDTLANLRQLVDAMDSTPDLQPFNDLDTAFHLTIAEIAGNPLLGDLTMAIRRSLRVPILDASRQLERWSNLRERLCVEHRSIFEAIQARDAQAAADRVEAHVRHAASALFGV